jgi:hypothetical protein
MKRSEPITANLDSDNLELRDGCDLNLDSFLMQAGEGLRRPCIALKLVLLGIDYTVTKKKIS